jgi:diguanylate cyclase (GGDEF)-like protein/PAS domain S-box-containing protein
MDTDGMENKLDRIDMLESALLVIDHVDAMLAYWDKDCICHFANHAYRNWFGKSRDEIIGKHIKKLLGPDLYNKNLKFITGALNGEKQVFEREIPLPDGDTCHSIATYTPHIVDDKVQGFFVLVADSTLLKKLEKQIIEEKERAEKLATHDFLTGLPNRVLLMDRIGNAISNANRNHCMFSVMSMDLDRFKTINDTYGHDVGDKLLQEIAKRLNKVLRDTDTVSRVGGDEFILITTSISVKQDAEQVAASILEAVSKPFECIDNITVEPTFSIGIAMYPTNGRSAEELIKNSDNALYEGKRMGKNCFVFA